MAVTGTTDDRLEERLRGEEEEAFGDRGPHDMAALKRILISCLLYCDKL